MNGMVAIMVQRPLLLIGGLKRSGTSLLRALLGSHSHIAVFQTELPLWNSFYVRFKQADLSNPILLDEVLHAIEKDPKYQLLEHPLDLTDIKREALQHPPQNISVLFERIIQQYATNEHKPLPGLKVPYLELYASDILKDLPHAVVLHMIRDPRDVAASHKGVGYGAWSYDPVSHAMDWKDSYSLALQHRKSFPERYHIIQYEHLVESPETVLKEICPALRIDFESDMLEMKGQAGWEGNNSSFLDIGKGVSSKPVGRFKEHLSPVLICLYQGWLKHALQELGYTKVSVRLSLRERLMCWFQQIRYAKSAFLRWVKSLLRTN